MGAEDLPSLFASGPHTSFQLNFNKRVVTVTNMMNSAATEQDAVGLARESFLGELKTLTKDHPDTGFGISLRTHSGGHYLLANSRMPLPKTKSAGFPTGRRLACLENSECFSSIEVLADSGAYETITPVDEAAILGNALNLIARIDTLTSTQPDQVPHHIAATGTGG